MHHASWTPLCIHLHERRRPDHHGPSEQRAQPNITVASGRCFSSPIGCRSLMMTSGRT
jgi:hypothetical protein